MRAHNFNDLSGQKFGTLEVLVFSTTKHNKAYWTCECECGNTKDICGSSLVNGSTKSCGCLKKGPKNARFNDITGSRFGKYTVISYDYSHGTKGVMWKCICDCGNASTVSGNALKAGNIKSCGCSRRAGLKGNRYNNLTAIEYVGQNSLWKCVCDCGNFTTLQAGNLIRGKTKSCGCMKEHYRRNTNIEKYNVDHPMRSPEIALKAARSSNKSSVSRHWFSREDIVCVGSYENAAVKYLNKNKIDYLWQVQTFLMPDGKTYTPDCYLPDEDRWIEIKGYFWDDAREKWEWFREEYKNSELWDKEKLKEIGIL